MESIDYYLSKRSDCSGANWLEEQAMHESFYIMPLGNSRLAQVTGSRDMIMLRSRMHGVCVEMLNEVQQKIQFSVIWRSF